MHGKMWTRCIDRTVHLISRKSLFFAFMLLMLSFSSFGVHVTSAIPESNILKVSFHSPYDNGDLSQNTTTTGSGTLGSNDHIVVTFGGIVLSITQNQFQVEVMGVTADPSHTLKLGNITYVTYNSSSIVDPTIKTGLVVEVSGWLTGPTGAGVTPSGYQVSILPESNMDYYIQLKSEGCGC